MNTSSTSQKKHTKIAFVCIGLLIFGAAIGYALIIKNKGNESTSTKAPISITETKPPQPTAKSGVQNHPISASSQSTTLPSQEKSVSTATPNPETKIAPPSGTFISNHTPNLSGSPAPSSESSVCNGSPGADCYIQLTNTSGTVYKLTPKTLDGNGTAYWQWDVNTNGLSAGTWHVAAIETLGTQFNKTEDTRDMVIYQ